MEFSVSGEIEVEKATAVAVRVGSGPIRCRDIGGPVSAESESGDVLIESAAGNVVVLSDSGNMIQRPGGRLRLVTESGDVELEIAGRFAGGEVSTATGDVSLSLGRRPILEARRSPSPGNLDVPGVEVPLAPTAPAAAPSGWAPEGAASMSAPFPATWRSNPQFQLSKSLFISLR